jgi:hypothetical protein
MKLSTSIYLGVVSIIISGIVTIKNFWYLTYPIETTNLEIIGIEGRVMLALEGKTKNFYRLPEGSQKNIVMYVNLGFKRFCIEKRKNQKDILRIKLSPKINCAFEE